MGGVGHSVQGHEVLVRVSSKLPIGERVCVPLLVVAVAGNTANRIDGIEGTEKVNTRV